MGVFLAFFSIKCDFMEYLQRRNGRAILIQRSSSYLTANGALFVLLQRSLSNTEDECTHLKEMSERGQEELRELANKYNAAVNEIKELTDKIKVTYSATPPPHKLNLNTAGHT